MKTSIHILEFPSNLGLIVPSPGKEPGVRRVPEWLRDQGFYDLISRDQIHQILPPPYSMHLDPESRIRNADAIADYAVKQAGLVKELIDRKTFVLANLMGNKYCAGLEITILDPDLDPQGQY